MDDDASPRCWNFSGGRLLLARLYRGADLLDAVEALCRKKFQDTALFAAAGNLTELTLGVYDPAQQVYVTERIEKPLELIACNGTVVSGDSRGRARAHVTAADLEGRVYAGRLFSPTRIVAAEVVLQALSGEPLQRARDELTGLWLWASKPSN